jgi:hypothetical protein
MYVGHVYVLLGTEKYKKEPAGSADSFGKLPAIYQASK